MFSNLSFDELNALVKNERSLPFEQYFGEMNLLEEDKNERIKIAEELNDKFLIAMTLLFTMAQFGAVDYEQIMKSLVIAYTSVLSKYMEVDDYFSTYIESFAYDAIDSTKRHEGEPYYYSQDRARFMSENEVNTAINYARFREAEKSGKTMKEWIAIIDNVTRESHRELNGKRIPIGQAFRVGDSWMMYPKDSSFGASANQICNCRCSIRYY